MTTAGTNHCATVYRGGCNLSYCNTHKLNMNRSFTQYTLAESSLTLLCVLNYAYIITLTHSVFVILKLCTPSGSPFFIPGLTLIKPLCANSGGCIWKPIGKLLQPLKSNLQIQWFSSEILTFPLTGCMSLQTTDCCNHFGMWHNYMNKEQPNILKGPWQCLCML